MTYAHYGCYSPAYLHGVCAAHLVATLAAGHRVTQTPQHRMAVMLRARYGAA